MCTQMRWNFLLMRVRMTHNSPSVRLILPEAMILAAKITKQVYLW